MNQLDASRYAVGRILVVFMGFFHCSPLKRWPCPMGAWMCKCDFWRQPYLSPPEIGWISQPRILIF